MGNRRPPHYTYSSLPRGRPPSLFWEASEAKNGPKRTFFGKIIAQKRCKYQCFCFLRLVAMESVIFEFVGIYGVSCMCFHKTRCVAKVSQIAVFWLHLLFGLLRKHRKYQCFGSILGLEKEKTSQIALFCSW